ncbi:hypothetical protein AOA81_06640 [Methanomassiliicoccales archaeon RumEn M2]|nr:hypothetical protein AOA81_06640 [Methanomassiliicoccales archaeon RumEn M2]
MPIPAAIPVIIGLYSLFDLGVFATSGKDVVEHVTGIDVIGSLIDWIFPSAAESVPLGSPEIELAGQSIMSLSSMATVAIFVILVVSAFFLVRRGH